MWPLYDWDFSFEGTGAEIAYFATQNHSEKRYAYCMAEDECPCSNTPWLIIFGSWSMLFWYRTVCFVIILMMDMFWLLIVHRTHRSKKCPKVTDGNLTSFRSSIRLFVFRPSVRDVRRIWIDLHQSYKTPQWQNTDTQCHLNVLPVMSYLQCRRRSCCQLANSMNMKLVLSARESCWAKTRLADVDVPWCRNIVD